MSEMEDGLVHSKAYRRLDYTCSMLGGPGDVMVVTLVTRIIRITLCH